MQNGAFLPIIASGSNFKPQYIPMVEPPEADRLP